MTTADTITIAAIAAVAPTLVEARTLKERGEMRLLPPDCKLRHGEGRDQRRRQKPGIGEGKCRAANADLLPR
jgi:hypothetical protein